MIGQIFLRKGKNSRWGGLENTVVIVVDTGRSPYSSFFKYRDCWSGALHDTYKKDIKELYRFTRVA